MECGRGIRHRGSEPQRDNMKIQEQSTAAGGEGVWWYFWGAAFDNIQLSVETHLGEKQQRAKTPVAVAPLMCS